MFVSFQGNGKCLGTCSFILERSWLWLYLCPNNDLRSTRKLVCTGCSHPGMVPINTLLNHTLHEVCHFHFQGKKLRWIAFIWMVEFVAKFLIRYVFIHICERIVCNLTSVVGENEYIFTEMIMPGNKNDYQVYIQQYSQQYPFKVGVTFKVFTSRVKILYLSQNTQVPITCIDLLKGITHLFLVEKDRFGYTTLPV